VNIKWKKIKPGISMITFSVNDLEKSIKFFHEGLGFSKMELSPEVAFNSFFWVGSGDENE
jgi:catechol 2,3-dioxygenase-like lactoylglutathione lyase family enzyme